MKNTISILTIISLMILSFSSFELQAQDETPELGIMVVQVTELENYNGTLRLSLFNQEEGFPGEPEHAFHILLHPIKSEGMQEIRIENIPFGKYGISIHHDEDDDMDLKTNWLGMPKEGIGTSNGAKGFMGPPKYEDAEFVFDHTEQIIPITMVYM
jgi:uncharacterized protein (DUF2141 family)